MSWFQQNAPPEQGSLGSLGGGMNDESLRKMGINAPSMTEAMQQGWTDWPTAGPQPVPGMPPRQLDQPNPNDQYAGIDWDRHLVGSRPGEPGFDPNKGFNQILYPAGQLPPGWQPNTGGINPNQGNRGSGQPINQPMMPAGSQGGPLPADAGPMPKFGPYGGGYDQQTHKWVSNTHPVGIAPTGGTGSLQSLGGGWVPGQPDFMGGTPLTADNMQQQLQAARSIGQSGMVNLRGPDGSSKAVPQSDLAHWLSKGAVRV